MRLARIMSVTLDGRQVDSFMANFFYSLLDGELVRAGKRQAQKETDSEATEVQDEFLMPRRGALGIGIQFDLVQPEFCPAGHVLNIAGMESPRREKVLARFEVAATEKKAKPISAGAHACQPGFPALCSCPSRSCMIQSRAVLVLLSRSLLAARMIVAKVSGYTLREDPADLPKT